MKGLRCGGHVGGQGMPEPCKPLALCPPLPTPAVDAQQLIKLTFPADGAWRAREAGCGPPQLIVSALPTLLLGGGASWALETGVAGLALPRLQGS